MDGHGSMLADFVNRTGDAVRSGFEHLAHVTEAVKEKVEDATKKTKAYAAKKLFPQPAGAAIEPCPKNKKAQRVAERKAKLAASKERLKTMPPGRRRDALAHATERFERNNAAVERARLADDVYKVGQGEPPEGWERVGPEDLKKMGMNKQNFPQLDPKFDPKKYKDGYYPELYRSKPNIFGEEQYVLAFRGTQGLRDGATDVVQAFGGETEQYSKAIKTAEKLKVSLGNKLEITGHSMGGGMATAAGLATGLKVYAFDPAGVHPLTLERVGGRYCRDTAKTYVSNYIAEGEILDCVQTPSTQRAILAGLTLVAPEAAGAMAFAGHRAMLEGGTVTYGALGAVQKVPILVNAEDVIEGNSQQGVSPGLGGKLANYFNPIRKVKLHDPKYVITGIEQQKADDLQMMKSVTRL